MQAIVQKLFENFYDTSKIAILLNDSPLKKGQLRETDKNYPSSPVDISKKQVFMIGGRKKKDCSDQTVLKGLLNDRKDKEYHRAIECLYLIYFPLVRSMVVRNSGTKADAEDIFQDTILAFLDNILKKGKPLTSSIRYFFLIIARNLWFKKLRRQLRTEEFNENMAELENSPNIEELLENERRYQAIEDCKSELTQQCREIIEKIGSLTIFAKSGAKGKYPEFKMSKI